MRRVVITGMGAVTPLAGDFDRSWELVKQGVSGIREISRFETAGLKWKAAGEIKKFDAGYLSRKEALRLDPFVQYSTAAAIMAVRDAGITLHPQLLDSCGVIIGSSRGGITTLEKAIKGTVPPLLQAQGDTVMVSLSNHAARLSPYLMPSTTISMAASHIAQKLGIRGVCLGISNACASGTNAIGEAFRIIKHGQADMIIAGGTEAPVCRICIEGYGVSGALSAKADATASRPFDGDRDGFVLAEGACVLVLEEYESAMKRGAAIYAEIRGYGNTTDAFHITRPDAGGEAHAILDALEEAGVSPSEIDYVNAHATSTVIGDRTEAAAIRRVFPDRPGIPVSSIKSMTGHMLAASGAFEVACTAMSIKEGVIPPTINLSLKDSDCDINVVTEMEKKKIDAAITNSFGFGGVNAVLVLKRTADR